MESEKISKKDEFRKIFDELPIVMIQDPQRQCIFFIPAEELKKFKATTETWTKLNSGTVTFVIPNGELFEEVPPFINPGETEPSVLIQYRKDQTDYFLIYDQLEAYKVKLDHHFKEDNLISFIIPIGWELIEELPSVRRALLQSNTSH